MATFATRRLKDGTIRHTVQVRRRGARPLARTFTRLTDARVWARSVEADIEAGKSPVPTKARKVTLAELVEQFLRGPGKGWPSNRTSYLHRWVGQVGHLTLAGLTRGEIIAARDELWSGRAPATVNRAVAYLSSVLSYAVEREIIPENPCRKLKLTEPRGRVRYLSDDELARLRGAVAAQETLPDLSLFVEAALRTGARAGELQGLRWEDIDFQRGVAILHETKNGERRLLPIRGALLEALRNKPRTCALVFTCPTGVGRIQYGNAWRAALKAVGIESFRFHDLRHHAASTLVQNGVDLYAVQHLLGHKSPTMTQRYAHLAPEAITDIGDKLGALL